MKLRVGFGFDVHRLAGGRPFWLGGVRLPSEKGPVGHSDADVLIHAICDALLGAANLRDIGYHFPNTDPEWKDKESRHFLIEVVRLLGQKGWHIENIDCTIVLEQPRVNPHIEAMVKTLAGCCQIDEEAISIKATTSERLGYVGREEGINAMAVALIRKD